MTVQLQAPSDEKTSFGLQAQKTRAHLPVTWSEEAETVLRIAHPLWAPALPAGKRLIWCTAWESTRLSEEAKTNLKAAELLLVPSQFCATVFSAAGFDNVRVVPLGYEPGVFYPEVRSQKSEVRGPFLFGCAGDAQSGAGRKKLDQVVRCFKAAFGESREVRLHAKCRAGHLAADGVNVLVDTVPLSESEMGYWHRELDCFVNLATGGFELHVLQSMACGVPVISHAFGGQADYFHEGNGLVLAHELVPAEDTWAGCGLWASVKDQALIEAMQWAVEHPELCRSLGRSAHGTVRGMTWKKHAAQTLLAMSSAFQPKIVTTEEPCQGLTACITSFRRPRHLERAIQCCYAAGLSRVVVSAMEPDDEVRRVVNRFLSKPGFTFTAIDADLGCNELWLQAAYRSQTERLIILHDDDYFAPELGAVYESLIRPKLDTGIGLACWRGHVMWDGGQKREIEWWHGPTRVLPIAELERFVGSRGRLSLSPVIAVFNRSVLIGALKEAQEHLTKPESWLRPGMLLGTEILAYLRHCSAFQQWLYVDQVLSYYGAHLGSGTVQAEQKGDLAPLVAGYDIAREHYFRFRDTAPIPKRRLLFVFNPYPALDSEQSLRFQQARHTWRFHFDQGELLEVPVPLEALGRSSLDMGDTRAVPFVKDMINYGMKLARPEDVVVLSNMDVCLTTLATDRIRDGVQRGRGFTACQRRNLKPIPAGRLLRTVVPHCKPDGGYDVFALTPQWWAKHRDKMPDMLMGTEAWDTVIRVLGEESAGTQAYTDDVCYHAEHSSRWQSERTTNPAQKHNRQLGREFFEKRHTPMASSVMKQLSA